jgi:hypothetical protein
MDHLRPELLQSVSDLQSFSFEPAYGPETRVTRLNPTPYELSVRVMSGVLGSAPNLRHLCLSLRAFRFLDCTSDIVTAVLDSTVSDNIERFVLISAKVPEEALLKALSRWGPTLMYLELGEMSLTPVRQGWLPILQLISKMPKLKSLSLWKMGEKRLITRSSLAVFTMNHLAKGHKIGGDRCGRNYSGSDEVLLDLEELLAGQLSQKGLRE